jgi:hypothetical protein
MIKGLQEMFSKAENIAELEKRSEILEKTLLDSIHAMESISTVIDNSKKIYDNSAIRAVMTEADHVALATNFAASQISWNDMNKIADMHNQLRKLYTEIYKKDAVTAASSKVFAVSSEVDKDGNAVSYVGTASMPQMVPFQTVAIQPTTQISLTNQGGVIMPTVTVNTIP